uniref:Ig-like domain-containing protein n=1 Tax=Oncorhynchus kisutch TaxID=8019 RepID=A0A8C7CVI6_ONCKI
MVWGGISLGDRTALHVLARGSLTAIRYRDEITWSENSQPDLKPKEVHLYRDEKDDLVLQNPVFRGRTSLFKEELENGNTSLKLTRVKLSDAGNYTCYIPLLNHQKTIIQLLVGESTHLLTTQTPLRDRSHEIRDWLDYILTLTQVHVQCCDQLLVPLLI